MLASPPALCERDRVGSGAARREPITGNARGARVVHEAVHGVSSHPVCRSENGSQDLMGPSIAAQSTGSNEERVAGRPGPSRASARPVGCRH